MTTISNSGGTIHIKYDTVMQYSVGAGSYTNITVWPVTITNDSPAVDNILNVVFDNNLTVSSTSQYFIMGSDYITIDGVNHTVTVDGVSGYSGLLQNGINVGGAKSNVIIQNIGVNTTNGSTIGSGGWLCQDNWASGLNVVGCVVDNCYSSGDISDTQGGLFGSGAGHNGGSLSVTNCYSSGTIGSYGGGIFGTICGSYSGTVIATNCYSLGTIGNFGGGIFAASAGFEGSLTAINCHSRGLISSDAGGIFGNNAGNNGTLVVTNCYSLGNIGNFAGGIFSFYAANEAISAIVSGCYSVGTIGAGSGGIFGYNPGSNGNLTVFNCYSLGAMGNAAGGIFSFGAATSGGTVTATNCYSMGSIGSSGGGIYSHSAAASAGSTATATNCYSFGSVNPLETGIFGTISGINGGVITSTNCYVANGTWNNESAIAALDSIGQPGSTGVSFGTIWTRVISDDTPWILSTVGASPYETPDATLAQYGSSESALITSGVSYSIIAASTNNTYSPLIIPLDSTTINDTTGVITTNATEDTYYLKIYQTFDDQPNRYTTSDYTLTVFVPLCFNEGTQILALVDNIEQYVPIQHLQKGSLVKTYKHGYKKIDMIGSKTLLNTPDIFSSCMYKMKKTDDMTDDLLITGWHSILVDALTPEEEKKQFFYKSSIDEKQLLLCSISDKFTKIEETKKFTYYIFTLETDDEMQKFGIWANGVLSETTYRKLFLEKKFT